MSATFLALARSMYLHEKVIIPGGLMRTAAALLAVFLSAATIAVSQARDDSPQLTSRAVPIVQENTSAAPADAITVPAGTRVPLTMKQDLTTKSARPGDPVYAQTAFPIVMNDRIGRASCRERV